MQVAANVSALLVEARWACDAPVCEFRVNLDDPTHGTVLAQTADGHVRFVVKAPMPGEWDLVLYSEKAVGMAGHAKATVFFGDVPEGYTAFA